MKREKYSSKTSQLLESKDDIVELEFILDNRNKTELHSLVKIMWVSDLKVAGQFIDESSLKQDLVLYLRK